ncbi:MAG: class I SAM-dependent rRNA methyltransferase [Candidatus Berkiellales bacterium]
MLHLPIKTLAIEKIQKGYPWVFAQDLQLKKFPAAKPGDLVYLTTPTSEPIAIGYINPLTKLCCRVLTLNTDSTLDENFFLERFTTALSFREHKFSSPFYRLVHAESDALPGLVIDRFGDTLVCQTNTAGMEKLKPLWFSALQTLLKPKRVIFRDDVPLRSKEGLELSISAPIGDLETLIEVEENGLTFYADPKSGQKTGWFYDQRLNRHWIAERACGKTVLDLYTYSGGFGIAAAGKGAKHVTLVDSSEHALMLVKQAATTNHVLSSCELIREQVFLLLPRLIAAKQKFELVIADPPAFVKQANHKAVGLRGYQKLSFLASQLVAPGGMFFIASCSHHATSHDFRQAVEQGIQKAQRQFQLLRKGGADTDHPIHPLLPQTHYLKSLTYKLN